MSQIFGHMTSDVKLLHHFLLQKLDNRDVFLTHKTFGKQFQSTKHSVNAGKLLHLRYTSLKTVFILIQMFLSLTCNMNGHHHKYFSVDIAF